METHVEIGIRAEDKSKWGTLHPACVRRHSTADGSRIVNCVQASSSRTFSDEEYTKADIPMINGFTTGKIILGNLKTMLF
jgi:hypothetical protein